MMLPQLSHLLRGVYVVGHKLSKKQSSKPKAGTTKNTNETKILDHEGHEGSRRKPISIINDFLRDPSCPWWLEVLEDSGCSHASADAHCDHSVAGVATFEFADYGRGELGSSTSQRMA